MTVSDLLEINMAKIINAAKSKNIPELQKLIFERDILNIKLFKESGK